MLFNSLDYFLFLALSLAGYWVVWRLAPSEGARTPGGALRLLLVFIASCAFYMAWNPYYIGLILFSTVLDYTVGALIHRAENPCGARASAKPTIGWRTALLGKISSGGA